MSAPSRLRLCFDARPAERATARLLALAKAGQISPEVGQLLVDGLEALFQFRTVDRDDLGAAAADDLRVVLEPTERLLVLVPALRTGDGDLGIVQEVHVSSPCAPDAGMKGDGAVGAGHPRHCDTPAPGAPASSCSTEGDAP